MQPRERGLAIAVGGLAGLWLLDSLLIGPAIDWYRTVEKDTAVTNRRVAEAKVLVDRADRIRADWRGQHAVGLLDDEDAARFRLHQAIAASARQSGVTIDSVSGGQRIPAPHGKNYDTIRLSLSGQGSLADVQGFLAGLEGAAMPLSIERCELAARDGRKDQVDCALTVSTRIVASASRATRHVPTGQTPWQPAAHDAAADAAVLAAKPFLNDRRSGKKAGTSSASDAAAPAATGWALVGIVVRDGVACAFVRNLADGGERILMPGDRIDPSGGETAAVPVAAISDAGLTLTLADGPRLVPVGCDLTGQPVASGRSASASRSATPAVGDTPSPALPGAAPAVGDTDRDAILQRLRQQRNRSR
jgi:hypothetical protein